MASRLVAPETHLFGKEDGTELHDSDEIRLRAFRPDGEDESQMRELMFDNAFLGEPFDVIYPCKEWLSDVVLTPYIKYQPENIHVAVHRPSGRLIGYLTGSLGGEEFEGLQYKLVKKEVISLALSLTMPWTFFDLSSRLFATHVIFRGEGERPSHPETGVHWNFQVAKDFRGHGIGTKLLRRFVHDALEADFRLIWAEVMAYPEKPPQYFGDRGWLIYDAKPTGIFGDHVDFPVQVMCITQPLSSLAVLTHPA